MMYEEHTFSGLDLYCTGPAQLIITTDAGYYVGYLDRHLSDVRTIPRYTEKASVCAYTEDGRYK